MRMFEVNATRKAITVRKFGFLYVVQNHFAGKVTHSGSLGYSSCKLSIRLKIKSKVQPDVFYSLKVNKFESNFLVISILE